MTDINQNSNIDQDETNIEEQLDSQNENQYKNPIENQKVIEERKVDNRVILATKALNAISSEIRKAVIGQNEAVEQVLVAMLAGGHVLLEGVPGLGKTLIVKSLAKTFGGEFSRVQFTPDLMPADITGHSIYNPKDGEFSVRLGPVFTNLLLADEINRAPAKTQSSLLEAMQEKQVTIDGKTYSIDQPFMVLATQNPIEQEGTYPLPEAQLDRFLMKVNLSDLSAEAEKKFLIHMLSLKNIMDIYTDEVKQVISAEQLIQLRQLTKLVVVDERVVSYVNDIVRLTREFPSISVGAGQRGGVALLACARAQALIRGQQYITPDDIKSLVLPVLRHRISLTAEAEISGLTTDQVLLQLLNHVDAPRQ